MSCRNIGRLGLAESKTKSVGDQNDGTRKSADGQDANIAPLVSVEKARDHSESTERLGLRRAWMYGALAMELTAGVVGGGIGGYFLDRWQGTSPVWTLILLLLGFTGGFVLMLRGFLKLEGESK